MARLTFERDGGLQLQVSRRDDHVHRPVRQTGLSIDHAEPPRAPVHLDAHRAIRGIDPHAHAAVGIALAVEAGVDGIEHCSFQVEDGIRAEQALIERIAAQQIGVAPTIGRPPWSPTPPQFAARREARMEVIARMHRAGVKLVTGTDAGIAGVPHDSAPWGIRAFAEAGLSNAEALRAGTSAAAESCGIAERKGTIAPGRDADLLAVGGNPLDDLAAIHDVRAVFRAGIPVVGGAMTAAEAVTRAH